MAKRKRPVDEDIMDGIPIEGEMTEKIEAVERLSSDIEIRRAAIMAVEAGDDPVEAVKRATEEFQSIGAAPVSRDAIQKRNKPRVKVEFLRGPMKGRRTEYIEEIAQIFEKRGEVKILGTL